MMGLVIIAGLVQSNLWPLLLIITSPVALAYLGAVFLAHRAVGPKARGDGTQT